MTSWTIGRRITLGFATVFAITLALGAFTYCRMAQVRTDFELVTENEVPGLMSALTIRSFVNEDMRLTYGHLLSHAADDRARLEVRMSALSAAASQHLEAY